MNEGIQTALHWEVEKPRHVWLFDYIAQVMLQATTVYWTEETEAALEDFEGGGHTMSYTKGSEVILRVILRVILTPMDSYNVILRVILRVILTPIWIHI